MKVAVAKETAPGETRVALIPDTVKLLAGKGHAVTVEPGAGEEASFSDEEYVAAGATMASSREALFSGADVVCKVNRPSNADEPGGDEVALLPEGGALISFLQPFAEPELMKRLAARKISAFAMEMIPRISRAQNMDALSSMATVAGYKAVLIAADALPRFMPMLMTAAGTVAPARALVLGAGVAGLQAIATAKRLGAVVSAFDTRPVVTEQVESLGARFVGLDLDPEAAEDSGGYAKELTEDQHSKEMDLIAEHIAKSDLVVTTAQIPGRDAPVLITEEMVRSMRHHSVIVDLAVESGGNCALSERGQRVERHGVTILGFGDLPRTMPVHASQMYARNVTNLLLHLEGESGLNLDLEDAITGGTLVTHGGEIVHPALKK